MLSLILTNVKDAMEKDKALKNFKEKTSNIFKHLYHSVDFLVKKIDHLDPSENTKQRVITALILLPLAVYAIYFSQSLFFFLATAITILMTAEWIDLIKSAKDQQRWRLIGLFYILIPIFSIIKLRLIEPNLLIWMFSIIWATDIFAFFAGKVFGGAKLAPKISPNKTWIGLGGGVAASMLIGLLSSFMFVSGNVIFFVIVSGLLAVLEQVSDLLESKFKRIFGVKDSGNIIPGHGGILDRLDGMMLLAPTVLFLVTIMPKKFL